MTTKPHSHPYRQRQLTRYLALLACCALLVMPRPLPAQNLPDTIAASDRSSGLDVALACEFEPRWEDRGSGADRDVALYEPVVAPGYWMIGGYAQRNYAEANGCVSIVRPRDSRLLAPPVDWVQVWADRGSGANQDGSIWRALPPGDDFVCLGVVGQRGYDQPTPRNYACVHRCLVESVGASQSVWTDAGSGAANAVGIYRLPRSNVLYAVPSRVPPTHLRDLNPRSVCAGADAAQLAPDLVWRLRHVLIDWRLATAPELGSVSIERAGRRIATQLGMELLVDDTLRTDARAIAVLAFGSKGSEVAVRSTSTVRISSVFVLLGEVFAWVVDYFEVQGEQVEMLPRGTEFLVKVGRGDVVEVTMVEGRVYVASRTRAWPDLSVEPFEQATAIGAQPPTKRILSPEELNDKLQWVKRLEQVIRPAAVDYTVEPEPADRTRRTQETHSRE